MLRLRRIQTLEQVIRGAEPIPWGWGFVGDPDDWVNDRRTFMPIPLNFVATWGRWLGRRLRNPEPFPQSATFIGLLLGKEVAFQRGYRYGHEDATDYWKRRSTQDVERFLALIADDYPVVYPELLRRWAEVQDRTDG
jgi:hypothetical protein